jgi:hypothetical protein
VPVPHAHRSKDELDLCYENTANALVFMVKGCCAGESTLVAGKSEKLCEHSVEPVEQALKADLLPMWKKCVADPDADSCKSMRHLSELFRDCLVTHKSDAKKAKTCDGVFRTYMRPVMPALRAALDGAKTLYAAAPRSDLTGPAEVKLRGCIETT